MTGRAFLRPNIPVTTSMEAQIDYWQSKFRILAEWDIVYEEDNKNYENYERVCHDPKRKHAVIYEGKEPDYIFHEILHICLAHIWSLEEYMRRREAEEQYIRDLCLIVFPEG